MNPRTDVSWPRSHEIAERLGLPKQQCYRNAVLALCSLPALQAVGFVYVEGYIFDYIATPHGWLANDHEILDPTLALSSRPGYSTQYFAAVSYPLAEVERLCTCVPTPFVDRDGHGGQSIAAYRVAEQAALDAMYRQYGKERAS